MQYTQGQGVRLVECVSVYALQAVLADHADLQCTAAEEP